MKVHHCVLEVPEARPNLIIWHISLKPSEFKEIRLNFILLIISYNNQITVVLSHFTTININMFGLWIYGSLAQA